MSTNLDTLYKINDHVTAMASEREVAFASEEIEDAVLDELTHTIAVTFGLETAAEAPSMTKASGVASTGISPIAELESILESLDLLADMFGAPALAALSAEDRDEVMHELGVTVAERFGYAAPRS